MGNGNNYLATNSSKATPTAMAVVEARRPNNRDDKKITEKLVLVLLIIFTSMLSSCITSERIVNPSVRHTGTANEPGTRIQPYPRADYEYNEQEARNAERNSSED